MHLLVQPAVADIWFRDQLLQEMRTRYISAQIIAAIDVALGDKEEAFHWLEVAATEHSGTLQWIAFLPEFRPLRSDKRFLSILNKIGLEPEKVFASAGNDSERTRPVSL